MGAAGGGSTAGCAGVRARGPTEVGGSGGSGWGVGGGGVGAAGGGAVESAGVLGRVAVHPEARASRVSVATRRFTLVLRARLLWDCRIDRRGRKTAPETRRGPVERTWRWQARRGLLQRRRRQWLPGLQDRRRCERARRRRQCSRGWQRARGRRRAGARCLAGHGRLTSRRRGWRARLRRVAAADGDRNLGADG